MTANPTVILTALNLEYAAVRQRLLDPRPHHHERGTRFEIGTLPGTTHPVVLALTGKGNHSAGVIAERAIQEFAPEAVLFVGVAGALRDSISLGDVVLATHVYAYHGGTSEDDGLKARPRVWEAPHELVQHASHLARTGHWHAAAAQDSHTPEVHFGAIAAGEIVQNSRLSHEAAWIRQHYNDAMAIEMEAAGVAQAGHLGSAPVAVVRGISDRADGTKRASEDGHRQPRAAANAAAFAVHLTTELMGQRKDTAMQHDLNNNRGGNVTNIASGQVGIQAGHISGSTISVGSASQVSAGIDFPSELAAVRAQLTQAHASGDVDEATYEAAHAELDIADQSWHEPAPEQRNTVILALKRLSGLVGDLADVATRIGSLIAAAQGMS